ncbi:MAG: hypothetical protein K8J31_13035 [Anaerolineae bacterium]|nr:hypothetical protein [Anaerolineae bacterium]
MAGFVIMLAFLLLVGILQIRDPLVGYYGSWVRVSELVHQGKSLYCTPNSPPGLYRILAKRIPVTLAPFLCFDTLDELNAWLNAHPQ